MGDIPAWLKEFSVVSGESIRKVKYHKIKIELKQGACSKFYRAHPVSYSIRDRVKGGLGKMEAECVIEKVESPTNASPMVFVGCRIVGCRII